ncbi:GNAT family N-acetyltransferase [Gracilibacillus sp. S3-1-1]|uniref:GNAT family N-acetyltransferase n=1 Tax=Gracilibacillus pellucidus TaxID=3095368 RepID=A0ACC6M6S4_9BACI|nr:GNAT family N-acetyltransferase [Gracilibacillus sp. S3-1-1]MDX8046674.1 GNAT family N-acetyltransferase [Gracilibacillus sp. S3-1-1]
MEIKKANIEDAPLIHELMIKAFANILPPSNALEETVEYVTDAIKTGEEALIGYIADQPIGMVRFVMKENSLYFFRLSILPEHQAKGLAKELLAKLEEYAKKRQTPKITCHVRKALAKNVHLYHSLGYDMVEEFTVTKPDGIVLEVAAMEKSLS